MRIIASGGVSSKNTLINTKGAVTLSLSTNSVAGIVINVSYTVDNVFVIVDNTTLTSVTGGLGYIKNATFEELLHYNIGTPILKDNVMTLNQVLEIYKNTDKALILNLRNQGEKTSQYIDQLLNLINNYPNINLFLKSSDEEVLTLLKSSPHYAEVGVIVSENNIDEWNNDYDFYVINTTSITREMIEEKLNNQKEVMTQIIQFEDQLVNAFNTLGSTILNEIYILTAFPMKLASIFKELEKTNYQ